MRETVALRSPGGGERERNRPLVGTEIRRVETEQSVMPTSGGRTASLSFCRLTRAPRSSSPAARLVEIGEQDIAHSGLSRDRAACPRCRERPKTQHRLEDL